MKFDCGETWDEWKNRLSNWHRWFAWYPVRVSDHDCRWLETVERRGEYFSSYADDGWDWSYRSLSK